MTVIVRVQQRFTFTSTRTQTPTSIPSSPICWKSSFSTSSMSPTISTPASAALGVLLFFRIVRVDEGAGSSEAVSSSVERSGVGARISGVGPEKSLPVIRDRVSISGRVMRTTGERMLNVTIHTVGCAIIEAIRDSRGVLLILSFKLVLTRLAIPSRENIRDEFVVLTELRERLRWVRKYAKRY